MINRLLFYLLLSVMFAIPLHAENLEKTTIVNFTTPKCGHACLKVALGLLGFDVTLENIITHIPEHQDGASIADLARFAETQGLTVEKFRGPIENISNSDGIIIIRVVFKQNDKEYKHYVVAKKTANNKFLVIDPYRRAVVYDKDSLNKIYLGDGVKILLSQGVPTSYLMKISAYALIGSVCVGGIFIALYLYQKFGGSLLKLHRKDFQDVYK